MHLEYSFEPTGPSNIRGGAYLFANGIGNGSQLPRTYMPLLSASWSAFLSLDISDDYSTVTLREFRYSQTDIHDVLAGSFDLAFFGTVPFEIQISSFAVEIKGLTMPLDVTGRFYAPLPGTIAFSGTSSFLDPSTAFS